MTTEAYALSLAQERHDYPDHEPDTVTDQQIELLIKLVKQIEYGATMDKDGEKFDLYVTVMNGVTRYWNDAKIKGITHGLLDALEAKELAE